MSEVLNARNDIKWVVAQDKKYQKETEQHFEEEYPEDGKKKYCVAFVVSPVDFERYGKWLIELFTKKGQSINAKGFHILEYNGHLIIGHECSTLCNEDYRNCPIAYRNHNASETIVLAKFRPDLRASMT